jgi:hypothetical protein
MRSTSERSNTAWPGRARDLVDVDADRRLQSVVVDRDVVAEAADVDAGVARVGLGDDEARRQLLQIA